MLQLALVVMDLSLYYVSMYGEDGEVAMVVDKGEKKERRLRLHLDVMKKRGKGFFFFFFNKQRVIWTIHLMC